MTKFCYEVYYPNTPENKHKGTMEANTPDEVKEKLKAEFYVHPIEVNVWVRDDSEVSALVVNNGSGICRPGYLDPDEPHAVFPK